MLPFSKQVQNSAFFFFFSSRRVKSELLIQMDGLNSPTNDEKEDEEAGNEEQGNVMVLGATNLPW